MVKIPEKTPSITKFFNSTFNPLKFAENLEVQAILDKSEERYYHWEKVKLQPFPSSIDANEIWAHIRLKRYINSNRTPILDIKGKPFTFGLTDNIQKCLHLICQSTSGNLALFDPESERRASKQYLTNSLMEEAITSSKIEGAVSTIKDAKKMLLSNRRPKDRSEQMIYNNFHTMQSLKEICKRELTLDTLLHLHSSITKETLDDSAEEGKFRTKEDKINVVTSYNEILFTPPEASEIQTRLKELCDFANDKNDKPFIHPVVKAIMVHFWMAYVHPFTDGNGRLARTLFYWYLLKHEYWLFEYTSISKTILKRTTQYANAYLYTEHDDNDLTYFIHFHVNVIMEAVSDLKIHIQKEVRKNQIARDEINEYPNLNIRQSRLIQHFIINPNDIVTIKIYQNKNDIVYETARSDLIKLTELGWLKPLLKGNVHYYMPSDNLWDRIEKKEN